MVGKTTGDAGFGGKLFSVGEFSVNGGRKVAKCGWVCATTFGKRTVCAYLDRILLQKLKLCALNLYCFCTACGEKRGTKG